MWRSRQSTRSPRCGRSQTPGLRERAKRSSNGISPASSKLLRRDSKPFEPAGSSRCLQDVNGTASAALTRALSPSRISHGGRSIISRIGDTDSERIRPFSPSYNYVFGCDAGFPTNLGDRPGSFTAARPISLEGRGLIAGVFE